MITNDRTRETTATTGTGTLTLAGAATGFQAFATAFATGDLIDYVIVDPATGAWETGVGTFTSPSTLTRGVLTSSNGNALVNFAAGSKDVYASLNSKTINSLVRALGPFTYAAPQTNPGSQTTLANYTIAAGEIKGRTLVRIRAQIEQAGTPSVGARYQILFGGSNAWGTEQATWSTTDTGPEIGVEVWVWGAATQKAVGNFTRDNGSWGSFGSVNMTVNTANAVAVLIQGRYNGSTGTPTLECKMATIEIVRS